MDDVLEEIERNRFSTLNDPGTHGIKTRLQRLGFVDAAPECCSGHPSIDYKTGKNYFDEGYIFLSYDATNPASRNFHNELREISVDYKEYYVFFTSNYPEDSPKEKLRVLQFRRNGKLFYKPQKFEDLLIGLYAEGKFNGRYGAGERFNIVIFNDDEKYEPNEVANALCKFWQKISDVIAKYEPVSIKEQLKPHYFGIRSIYGTIAAAHPAFSQYYPYLEHSDVLGDYQYNKGSELSSIVRQKSEEDKEKDYFLKRAKIAASILVALGLSALGFGTLNWYYS